MVNSEKCSGNARWHSIPWKKAVRVAFRVHQRSRPACPASTWASFCYPSRGAAPATFIVGGGYGRTPQRLAVPASTSAKHLALSIRPGCLIGSHTAMTNAPRASRSATRVLAHQMSIALLPGPGPTTPEPNKSRCRSPAHTRYAPAHSGILRSLVADIQECGCRKSLSRGTLVLPPFGGLPTT